MGVDFVSGCIKIYLQQTHPVSGLGDIMALGDVPVMNCSFCRGSGGKKGEKCSHCNGAGLVRGGNALVCEGCNDSARRSGGPESKTYCTVTSCTRC